MRTAPIKDDLSDYEFRRIEDDYKHICDGWYFWTVSRTFRARTSLGLLGIS